MENSISSQKYTLYSCLAVLALHGFLFQYKLIKNKPNFPTINLGANKSIAIRMVQDKPVQKVVKKDIKKPIKKKVKPKKTVTTTSPINNQKLADQIFSLDDSKVFNNNVIHSEAPLYPRLAKRRGITGNVRFLIKVNPDGTVSPEILESSGHKLLDESALKALKNWTFKPLKNNSHKIVRKFHKNIIFKLI